MIVPCSPTTRATTMIARFGSEPPKAGKRFSNVTKRPRFQVARAPEKTNGEAVRLNGPNFGVGAAKEQECWHQSRMRALLQRRT